MTIHAYPFGKAVMFTCGLTACYVP